MEEILEKIEGYLSECLFRETKEGEKAVEGILRGFIEKSKEDPRGLIKLVEMMERFEWKKSGKRLRREGFREEEEEEGRKILEYKMPDLSEKQKEVYKGLWGEKKYFLLHGGARAGKSFLLCVFFVARSCLMPLTKRLIVRKTLRSVMKTVYEQTLLEVLKAMLGKEGEYWKSEKGKQQIVFSNGSVIELGGIENGRHPDAVLGSEWADIFIGEITDIDFLDFEKLLTRLHHRRDLMQERFSKLVCDCNPKGRDHWVKGYFLEKKKPSLVGEKVGEEEEELPKEIREKIGVYHFLTEENAHVSEDYLKFQSSLKGVNRSRFCLGVWEDSEENRVYEVNEATFVRRAFLEEEGSEVWTSWDFGIDNPTAILFLQVVKVGKAKKRGEEKGEVDIEIRFIDEWQGRGKTAGYCKEMVLEKGYSFSGHAADPAGKARSGAVYSKRPLSWIDVLGPEIKIETAKKTMIDYLSFARQYSPALRVCKKQCPLSAKMLSSWKTDGNDRPLHDEYSHLGSALYYFLAVRFGKKKPQTRVT